MPALIPRAACFSVLAEGKPSVSDSGHRNDGPRDDVVSQRLELPVCSQPGDPMKLGTIRGAGVNVSTHHLRVNPGLVPKVRNVPKIGPKSLAARVALTRPGRHQFR